MPVHTVILWIAAVILCIVTARAVSVLYKYAGQRVITCPENRQHAGVELEVRRVLVSGLVSSSPRLRLSSCTRWPERAGCGQECLGQIEAGPQSCLVRTIFSEWYANKKCSFCNVEFGDIQWAVRKPAVLVDGKISDCDSISADRLLEVLAVAKPVCFSCRTATSWVHEHPDLITNRSVNNRK